MSGPKIVGIGSLVLDEVHLAEGVLEPDAVLYIRDTFVNLGGMVGNALSTAARMGAEAVVLGAVGGDVEGTEILRQLRSRGVDASLVAQIDSGSSPRSIVFRMEADGTRTIFNRKGVMSLPGLPAVSPSCLDDASCLHLDGFWIDSALELAKEARKRGIPVTADMSQNMAPDSLFRLLEHIDFFVPSIHAMKNVTGETEVSAMADRMMERGCRRIVITMGKEGSYCREQGSEGFLVPVFPSEVVDTNGLGDIFHGALAYAVTRGWSFCGVVEYATAAAAIACGRTHEGTSHLPGSDETDEFLKRRKEESGQSGSKVSVCPDGIFYST